MTIIIFLTLLLGAWSALLLAGRGTRRYLTWTETLLALAALVVVAVSTAGLGWV